MENEKFKQLLLAVKGEDVWAIRGAEAAAIIKDLTQDGAEFEEVCFGVSKISIELADLPAGTMAQTTDGPRPGQYKIAINKACWEKNRDFSKTGLRHVLAHELLHCLTDEKDDDPNFKDLARKKGVDVWRL